MQPKTILPYGTWPSPITPALASSQRVLSDVQWAQRGRRLVWHEWRGDRGVIMSRLDAGEPRDLDVPGSVSGGVGYGGGEFCAAGDRLACVVDDTRLFVGAWDNPLVQVSPQSETRLASPCLSPDGRWVACVASDGKDDWLAGFAGDGRSPMLRIASGADFYMQPAWSPDGKRLAWVEWDQPNMPWDGARLMLADLDSDSPSAARAAQVAGGIDVPVFQPEFSPDGRWLSYLAGEGEWDQLCLRDLAGGQTRMLASGGLLPPAWAQGERAYAWGRDRIYFLRSDLGFISLWSVGIQGSAAQKIDLPGCTFLSQPSVSLENERVALLASSPSSASKVIVWDAAAGVQGAHSSVDAELDPEDLPEITSISWCAPDGTTVYGLYSPPRNAHFSGAGLPPAVIYVHGGPTSQSQAAYSSDTAFFTSRGYAWLSVNYRGSTGYGRSYQHAMDGRWGETDVEDACGAAEALVAQGLADPRRLVIKGGSAGGYTLLNCLIHRPGLFAAGLCSYGVSDLFGLAKETHKFERAYTDRMVGPLPQAAELYRAWSPINHVGQIVDPLAIFQGEIDKVVPHVQSDTLAASLMARGVACVYKIYPGEGHGFRKPASLEDYYRTAEAFLNEHLSAG